MNMQQDTPPSIVRMNIITRYSQLILIAILIICSVILGKQVSSVQVDNNGKIAEIPELGKCLLALEKQELPVIPVMTAGISRDMEMMMKEPLEPITAGISREIEKMLKEPQPVVEELEVDMVTATGSNYKSIEEVEISRNMDLTETTGLSREDFCELLADFKYDYDGFYARNAGLIWDLSQECHVNEIFMCGAFALESYYGSDTAHCIAHNYGSIMTKDGKLVKYASDKEGIEANFKLFANSYLSPEGKYYKGVTLDSIGDTYCPPTANCPSWADKVYDCMKIFLEE